MTTQQTITPYVKPTLTDEEKVLIRRWIEPNPFRPGIADARVQARGVSVWALIGYYHLADNDLMRVAEDYEVEPDAVRAALAFYRRHQPVIDARIAANSDDDLDIEG